MNDDFYAAIPTDEESERPPALPPPAPEDGRPTGEGEVVPHGLFPPAHAELDLGDGEAEPYPAAPEVLRASPVPPPPPAEELWMEEAPQMAPAAVATAPAARPRVWLWAVPTAVLLAACVFLLVQNRAAAATVDALATRVPQLLLPVGEQNPLGRQLTLVSQSAATGNFWTARQQAAALALPEGAAPALAGDTPRSGPSADQGPVEGATPQADAFFQGHPDLAQRMASYVQAATELKAQGKDLQPLRELRTQILQAATAGNAEQVSALLDQFAQGLQALGGNPQADGPRADGPQQNSPQQKEIQQILADFQKALDAAQRENRDPRPGVALMDQAEATAHAGNKAKALDLARQALAALQHAKKLPAGARGPAPSMDGRGPAGRAPAGPPPAQAQRMLSVVMPMVSQEGPDLAAADEAMGHAMQALQQDDEVKTREALAQAHSALLRIGQRRQAVNKQLAPPPPAPAHGNPPASTHGGPATATTRPAATQPAATQPAATQPAATQPAATQPGATQPAATAAAPPAAEKLGEMFDKIRSMTPEQYKVARDQLAQQVVGLLLVGSPEASAGPPPQMSFPPAMPAEDRTREKLDVAQEACLQLKKQGKDVAPMLDALTESRADLAAGRVGDAEKKVDVVLKVFGFLPPDHPVSPPPPAEQPAPPLSAGKAETH